MSTVERPRVEVPSAEPARTRRHSRVRRSARRPGEPSPLTAGLGLYGGVGVTATLLALFSLGMYSRPLGIPLVYSGDALSGGSQVKGTLDNGWYERNPSLGAPFGQNMHDFPMADNLQFVFARILGMFTDQWAVVYNLAFLSTFPLTAMAAAWFTRVCGARRPVAFLVGLLYAFTPYHFIHSQPHLALSMLFVVPLFAGLVVKVLSGSPLWPRRGSGRVWDPRTWATAGTLGTLAVLVLTGSTSSYYAVFGLILMTFALALTLLRRRWGAAFGALVAMGGLMAVMVVNMAPDILYARSVEVSPAAFERQPLDSEIYALKLASLLFPAPWHRIGELSTFRLHYDGTFPNPGESPTLGLVGAVGFVFLLSLPLLLALRKRPASENGPLGNVQRHLALLSLVAFLFGTMGGLGTVFALLVSPEIRGWNRIVVYIALFGLAAVGLLLDALLRRLRAGAEAREGRYASWQRRAATPLAGIVLLTAVGALGLWDEAAPASWTASMSDAETDWSNDEAYVRDVEQVVPAGTSVFELPVMQYPESPPIWEIHDYDPIRPYLHSTDLKWSYGALKGRPDADWQPTVAALPVIRMAVALAASGFGGIHIDRYGYPQRETGELEEYLRELVGPPIESPDNRWAFYDLTGLDQDVRSSYTRAQLASIRRHTVQQPVFYWQPGFAGPLTPDGAGHLVLVGTSSSPSATIDNPGGPIPMKLSFTVRAVEAESSPAQVSITWPDGEKQSVNVDEDGTEVSHAFTAQTGQQTLRVTGSAMRSVNLQDLVLRDPGLYFTLKGAAAELADAHAEERDEAKATEGEGSDREASR